MSEDYVHLMAAEEKTTRWTTRRLATHGTEVVAVVGAMYEGLPVAVTAGDDGQVRLWPLAGDAEPVLIVGTPGLAPTAMAGDGRSSYVGWSDGTVTELLPVPGMATPRPGEPLDSGSPVTALASFVDADGRHGVVSATADGSVLVDGHPVAGLRRDDPPVSSLAVIGDVLHIAVPGEIRRCGIANPGRVEPMDPIPVGWLATRLGVGRDDRGHPILLATGGQDVWRFGAGGAEALATLAMDITAFHTPDGGRVAAVGTAEGRLATLTLPEVALEVVRVTSARVSAIGSHGNRLIVGDADGGVWVVEPGGGGGVPKAAVGAVVSDRVELQDDVPGETYRDDRLRRMPLAEALAVRLQRRHEEGRERSFLVHLDGPWGSGKTTVLNFVADSLGPDWTIVRYNAWRQSRIGPHWWTLLTALRGEILRRRSPAGRVWLWAREMFHQRIGRASGLPASLFLVLVALAVFVRIRPDGTTLSEVLTTFEGVAATGAALATLIAGSQFVGRFFGWHSPRGAKAFQDLDANPMDRVAQHFSWLVRQERRPIAYFVDDLDRCPAADVVELLESVQTLVRDAGDERGTGHDVLSPCIVVAGDGAWIRNAFEESYREFAGQIAEPGRPLGYLFLAKIFQLTLPVPRIGPVRQAAFFRELLGLPDPEADPATAPEAVRAAEARVATAPDDDAQQGVLAGLPVPVREAVASAAVQRQTERAFTRATEHRLTGFAELLPDNPRAVKRFLNAFALTRTVRTIEGQAIPTPTLALWTILQIRWPRLADALTLHPEWAAPGEGGRDPAVPDNIRELLDDPDVQSVLRFADGGPLTPDLVRACRGG